jgi:hypothetical protein
VFVATYRAPANAFEIMDNVSRWSSGKVDPQYRAWWTERWGMAPEDEARFAAYKDLRKRYYEMKEELPRQPLFGPVKPVDRIAAAFYGAATFDAAFERLGAFMAPEDVALIRDFHAAYAPRYAELLDESTAFRDIARELEERLAVTHADAFAEKIARFYRAETPPTMEILFVWWPPIDETVANVRDRTLLLKYNPKKHRATAGTDVDLPVHELVHWVSGHQPDARKAELAAAFLARCDVRDKIPEAQILEEPMAVVQQKMFLRQAAPDRFDFEGSWYGDPWVGVFAKLLYDPVERAVSQGRSIDPALMTSAGKACAQLRDAASKLTR